MLCFNSNHCFRLDTRFIFLLSKRIITYQILGSMSSVFSRMSSCSIVRSSIKSLSKSVIEFSHKVMFDSIVSSNIALMYSVYFTFGTLVYRTINFIIVYITIFNYLSFACFIADANDTCCAKRFQFKVSSFRIKLQKYTKKCKTLYINSR